MNHEFQPGEIVVLLEDIQRYRYARLDSRVTAGRPMWRVVVKGDNFIRYYEEDEFRCLGPLEQLAAVAAEDDWSEIAE